MRKASPLLLAMLLLAGCTGADESIVESTPEPAAPADAGRTVSREFKGEVGLQVHGIAPGSFTATGTLHEFLVESGARWVNATLLWTSIGNLSDLDLVVASREGRDGCNLWAHPDGFAKCVGGMTAGMEVAGHYGDLGGRPGAPDQPSRVDLGRAALVKEGCAEVACYWNAIAFTKGVVAQATLTFRIDIVYPGGAPEPAE